MLSCNSDSWQRYTLKFIGVLRERWESSTWGSNWRLLWGLFYGTSGRRKLCMVPCRSYHIYGIWRSKEVGKALKSSFEVAMQATRRSKLYGNEGFSLCNTDVLKLYWSFTGYCKLFYRILYTSFPYITAVLPVLNLLRLARPKVPFKVS